LNYESLNEEKNTHTSGVSFWQATDARKPSFSSHQTATKTTGPESLPNRQH